MKILPYFCILNIITMEEAFDWRTHGDFRKYYDTKLQRNYWILGYFGGSINVSIAYLLAQQYAESTGVPLDSVIIDEVSDSSSYKYYKVLYSTKKQKVEADCNMQLPCVWEFLTR